MKDRKFTLFGHKFSVWQTVRHAIQLVSFILIPGLFITIFYSMKDIWTSAIGRTFAFGEQLGNILITAAALIVTAIWGRVFCGFFCSFGAMQDLLWAAGERIPLHPRISRKADRAMKAIKYVVLVFVVIAVWTFALPADSVWSPWTVFGAFTTFGTLPAKEIVLSVGGALLLVTVIGSLLIERFFCRYLCPLGAVFSIVSRYRLFGVKRKPSECGNCRYCTKKCAMAIPLHKYDKVASGECVNCMKCVSSCPRSNIGVEAAPAVTGIVAAAALFGMVLVGPIPERTTQLTQSTQIAETLGKYADGVYTGSGQGYKGTVNVTVTVEDGGITDITVDSYRDDGKYFSKAKSGVISQIISAQDTDVSTVSGATFSSRGIIEAVENALADAEYKSAEVVLVETDAENETQAETEKPVVDGTITTTEKAAEQIETESEAPQTEVQTETEAQASSGAFADGVYTGTGTGLRGTTAVSVTVEGGRITDITVTSYQDDAPYFSRAQSGVIGSILSSQGINVSTVSGATFSSNSIIEAVADALELEFTNPNSSHGGHRRH